MSMKEVSYLLVACLLSACRGNNSDQRIALDQVVDSNNQYSSRRLCWSSQNGVTKVGIVMYDSRSPAAIFLTSPRCYLSKRVYEKYPISDFMFRPSEIKFKNKKFIAKNIDGFDSFLEIKEWPVRILAAEVILTFQKEENFSEENFPAVQVIRYQDMPREIFGKFLSDPAERSAFVDQYLEGQKIGIFDHSGYRDGDRN